jgi:hypothetical protein
MKKAAAIVVLSIALAVVATTLVALEGSEVAVLHTALGSEQPRETRIWVVDFGGTPWIEAANPEREFYRDILADPKVELARAGKRYVYRAVAVIDSSGHDMIRAMLREKYGWADRWIAVLVDTSRSIAIRLEPR